MPYRPVPLRFERIPAADQVARARAFFERMRTRRSVRDYAPDPVPGMKRKEVGEVRIDV